MLFSRIAMDIAPYEPFESGSSLLILYILLAVVAVNLLAFAVIFTLVRRKRARAREAQKQTQEQGKQDPGK